MLVPGTSSYDEDVTSNLLDFITETTPVREANDDIADQEQEAESWINYTISIQFNSITIAITLCWKHRIIITLTVVINYKLELQLFFIEQENENSTCRYVGWFQKWCQDRFCCGANLSCELWRAALRVLQCLSRNLSPTLTSHKFRPSAEPQLRIPCRNCLRNGGCSVQTMF